ncbi:MAG: transcription antitermination factor NusB [Clostridia bacterium]|nr:transcription antitermination factor NusB [Clostridia bacterium]
MAKNTFTRRQSREQALCYLYEYSMQPDLPPSAIISSARTERDADPSPYATLLFKTALEHLDDIDAGIRASSRNWDFERISKVSLAILRMTAAEVLFLPEHPAAEIAVNEALELARMYGTEDSVPFINGILGTMLRP